MPREVDATGEERQDNREDRENTKESAESGWSEKNKLRILERRSCN